MVLKVFSDLINFVIYGVVFPEACTKSNQTWANWFHQLCITEMCPCGLRILWASPASCHCTNIAFTSSMHQLLVTAGGMGSWTVTETSLSILVNKQSILGSCFCTLPTYLCPCVQSGRIGESPLAGSLGKQWVQDVFGPCMFLIWGERTLGMHTCGRSITDQNSPIYIIIFERMP